MDTNINSIMTTHFMLVNTRSSKPAQQRVLKQATHDVAIANGADEDCVVATKKLWEGCPEMRALSSAISSASDTHRRLTANYQGDGPRLIRNACLIETYVPEMNKAISAIKSAAACLELVYDERVQQQLNKLGGFGSVNDYPTVDQIREWNWFEYNFVPVPSVSDWSRVEGLETADYLAQEVRESTRKATEDAASEAIKDAMGRAIKAVERMAYITEETDVGKKARRVTDTLLPDVTRAVYNIKQFNIFNDPAITQIADDMQARLTKFSSDQIRGSDIVKEHLNCASKELLGDIKQLGW